MKGERDPWADGESCSSRRGPVGRDVQRSGRRGARARFDNATHAGRHSPVRKALRLPDEVEGSEGDTHRESDAAEGTKAGSRRKRRVTAAEVALRRGRRAEARRPSGGSRSRSSTTPSAPRRSLDPWADEEPVFGQREVTHALSPTPGTPPLGNLAVSPPARRGALPGRASVSGRRDASPALSPLREPIRVELELEHCGRWTCGLAEKASGAGLEISLGFRGIGTRDFLAAGRRVRLLISPHGERPFQLHTRILWVDSPSGPSGAVRAQLAVDTGDTGAVARWQGLVERQRR